jgi:hypothetical protein
VRIADLKLMRPRNALLLIATAAVVPAAVVAQKHPDLRLNHGEASSGSVQIAASADSVYVTWEDGDIRFNRSLDGGASWLSTDLRLDTDSTGAPLAQLPKIAASGDSVYVIWQNYRTLLPALYFNRSLDGGATWLSAEMRLGTNLSVGASQLDPQIAASGDSVYVTWHDSLDHRGRGDIYFNCSHDGGATWLSSDLRLNTDPSGADVSKAPRIAVSGESVYVTWLDDRRDHFDIFFNCSLDGGATWLGADMRLDTDQLGAASSWDPQIAAAGDAVYVSWNDIRNGNWDIYFNCSLDRGATWLNSDMRLDTDLPGAGRSSLHQIAASGDSVYVTWEDERGGNGSDIYFNRSLDRGTTWLSSDIRLDTDLPGANRSALPRLAASGHSVVVTWLDERNGGIAGEDIYCNRSLDGGATWLASDTRLDRDSPGAARSYFPQIAASGDSVYVTWTDQRSGRGDIYFNIPFGAQPYGEGTVGAGGSVPHLHGTDSLNLGSTFTLTVADGLGGAFGILTLGGYGSKVSPPAVGAAQLINPIDLLVPILLDGASGVPGAGTYSIDIEIPEDNALLGFNVNLQALFFDSSAMQGVAWTNGVEAWIL